MTEPGAEGRAIGLGGLQLVGSRVAIFLSTGVSTLVLARVLGPDDFGVVASATAVTSILLVFGSFGLDQLYLIGDLDRHALRVRSTQVFLATSAITLVGALLWPSVSGVTRACVALAGLAATVDYLRLPYLLQPQKDLDFGRRARREVLLRLVVAAAAVAGAAIRRSPVAVATAMLIASLALMVPARAVPLLDRRLPLSALRTVLKHGMPFAVSGALYTLYFQVDMALLASLAGPDDVAQYRAAYNFFVAAVVVAVALNNEFMRPRLYRVALAGRQFAAILRTSALASVAVGVAGTALMVGLGRPAIRLAYGGDYRPAGTLLTIIGLAVLPHFLNSWAGNALVAQRRVGLVVRLQAVLVAINVAGNLILIPTRGARGAAIMTVVTEWTGTALYAWVVGRSGLMRPRSNDDEALPEQSP